MACYYIVISSTHLSNGHFRNIKGVFRGPLSKNGNKNLDYAEKEKSMAKALEGLKANFYCELCDKQYYKHQEFDNHINSYDHAHTQRLKELKQREFARNVASKTRKDERKQERALRRLHELAEQRREVQCAPGSGPKFKSTTVAVEGSFRETCIEGPSEDAQNSTMLDTGNQNHMITTTSSGSGHSSKQTMWPYTGKTKKQTYRRQIGFSFSFPKKASLKLESSAAVFCESIEEGSKNWRGKQKLRWPLIELNIPAAPTEEKGLHCAVANTPPHDKFSPRSVSAGGQVSSEKLAGPDTMPPASDLCALLVYSENIASPYVPQPPTSPCHINNNTDTVVDTQKLEETLENSLTESKTKTNKHSPKVEVSASGGGDPSISASSSVVVPDVPPESDSSSSSSSLSPTREEDVTVKPLCPFTKPSQPFFSVLSRDGSTVLQWPSEMLTCTRTQPCLSYSCNPLHFDFKASQARVKGSDTQNKTEPRFAEVSCISPEKPIELDKQHNKQSCSGLDHSPIEDEETVERKGCHICEHYMSDTESFSRIQRHRGYSTRCRHSNVRTHSGKRAAEKWKSRDRRHYRSHKKKKRRRRRRRRRGGEERYRDTDGGESDVEKRNRFQRWPECWEGHDNQFRGTTSQKVQPLEKSKQSALNQEEEGSMAPSAERAGSGRQESAGGISGPAGSTRLSDEGATDTEKVFWSSGRDQDDPSTEQRNTTGHGSNRCHDDPSPESLGTITKNPDEAATPCTLERFAGEGLSESQPSGRKRAAATLDPGGDQDLGQSCSRCHPSRMEPTGLESTLDEDRPGWSECASCEEGRQRKRQRGASYTAQTSHISPEILTDGDGCKLNTQSENPVNTTVECLVLKDPPESSSALSHPVLADSRCSSLPMNNTSSMKDCSLSQPVPVRNPTEIVFAMNESKDSSIFPSMAKYTIEMDNGKVCSRQTVAAQLCPLGERESRCSQMQKASLDKSCQHSPQSQRPRGHPGVRDQDERGVRENLIPGPYHRPPSPYHRPASPYHRQCFQPPPDSMEKHCLLQIQTHRHVLHQQVFSGKMKPVHPGSHVSVSPPTMLHPVHHLPSPMPSGSITIRHTILQHHTAFLPPQPPLFRHQILPVSTLPMGAEICPPGPPPPFAAPPQLSVVAPPTLHPMALTFHTLPRPAMYPSMLRPHPTVIPLQPMF